MAFLVPIGFFMMCGLANDGALSAAVDLIIVLPLLQLLALFITCLILFIAECGSTTYGAELRKLGKMAIGSTVGTLVGLWIMYLLSLHLCRE